jgi:hypothetical protein
VDFENYVDFVDFVDLADLVQSMNPFGCVRPLDLVSTTTTTTMSAHALPTHFKLNNGTSIPVVGLGKQCPPCPVADGH